MEYMDSHCLAYAPTSYNHIQTYREDIQEMKQKKKPKKTKSKKYPLDEYIEQVWYDDWLKKQEAKGIPIKVGKHYWKVGGSK